MSAAVPPESRPDSLPDQPVRTLVALADQTAVTLDQTRLPFDRIELVLRQATDCIDAGQGSAADRRCGRVWSGVCNA